MKYCLQLLIISIVLFGVFAMTMKRVQYVYIDRYIKEELVQPPPDVQHQNEFVRIGHVENDIQYKPLYGKRLGRDIWKYCVMEGTQDTGFFPVSVVFNNRNCLDHNGCRQIYDQDTVTIDNNNKVYQVKMYDRMLL